MNTVLAFFRRKYVLAGILLFFALLYADISLVNHYLFRTFAWDLGIFNNAIWDYSHFRINANNLPFYRTQNLLSGHFEIYPMLLSPLRFIFGTYSLLVAQIASMLFGGYGVYRFLQLKTGNETLSLLGMLHFFLSWGIFAALSFDYHNNVVAAMLVPWFLYYFERQNFRLACLLFMLVLIGKENMALWAVFISLALALSHLKDKPLRNFAFLLSALALAYFVVIVAWVVPSLGSPLEKRLPFQYSALGAGFGNAFHTILTSPIYAFNLLFINTSGAAENDRVKLYTHLFILCSGGWALFFRPKYLIMLIPIYGQKFFNDDPLKWGLEAHYSVELTPIISIALFEVAYSFFKAKRAMILGVTVCIATACLTVFFISGCTEPERLNIFSYDHYHGQYDPARVNKAIELIPANAPLSVQTEFCPHVAFRDTVLLYPWIRTAKYLLISRLNTPWPITTAEFQENINEYLTSGEWQKVYDKDNILIVKRK